MSTHNPSTMPEGRHPHEPLARRSPQARAAAIVLLSETDPADGRKKSGGRTAMFKAPARAVKAAQITTS